MLINLCSISYPTRRGAADSFHFHNAVKAVSCLPRRARLPARLSPVYPCNGFVSFRAPFLCVHGGQHAQDFGTFGRRLVDARAYLTNDTVWFWRMRAAQWRDVQKGRFFYRHHHIRKTFDLSLSLWLHAFPGGRGCTYLSSPHLPRASLLPCGTANCAADRTSIFNVRDIPYARDVFTTARTTSHAALQTNLSAFPQRQGAIWGREGKQNACVKLS